MIRRHLARARERIHELRRVDPGAKKAPRPKVLLLNNNARLASSLEELLAGSGCSVAPIAGNVRDGLADGEEFVLLIAGLGPDGAVLDIIRVMGRDRPEARVIVVAESGMSQRLHLRVAEYFGARVVQEPVDPGELMRLIETGVQDAA